LIASDLRARAFVLVVAALLASAAPARAEPAKADGSAKRAAQTHLDRGNELFTHDAYAEALVEFEAAFALFGSPKLHLNMGQCERALGHDAAAADHFQRFLDEARDVSPALRAEAERHLAEARAAVATAQAKVADVAVAAPVTPPAPSPLPRLAPPTDAPPKLVATPPPPPPVAGPLTKRWWFWAGLGAVAAGAGVSIFLLTRSRDPKCDPSITLCF
jgi:tetratricopeptide (TPR) repeat protein